MGGADGSFSSQYTRWHATLHLPLFHILVGKGQGPTKIKMPPPIRAFTNGAHVCQQSNIALLPFFRTVRGPHIHSILKLVGRNCEQIQATLWIYIV